MSTQSTIFKPRSIISKLQHGKKLLFNKIKSAPPWESTISNFETESISLFESLAIGTRAIILDADIKQTKFAVQNIGATRLVLLPSVHRLPETQSTSIVSMPLMMELDIGESAAIDYFLVAGETDTEQLFRARFEWFQSCSSAATQEAETSIPLLVRPAGLENASDPCESLSASINEYGDVIIENRSACFVCVSPLVVLLPSDRTFVIPQRYIAPHSWQLCRAVALGITSTAIRLTVETLNGIPSFSVDLELHPWIASEHRWLGPFD